MRFKFFRCAIHRSMLAEGPKGVPGAGDTVERLRCLNGMEGIARARRALRPRTRSAATAAYRASRTRTRRTIVKKPARRQSGRDKIWLERQRSAQSAAADLAAGLQPTNSRQRQHPLQDRRQADQHHKQLEKIG